MRSNKLLPPDSEIFSKHRIRVLLTRPNVTDNRIDFYPVTVSCEHTHWNVCATTIYEKNLVTRKQSIRCRVNGLLISSWTTILFVTVIPKYLNFATFSKGLLAIFMLWFCPAFWWRDINMYLVFSAFTSRPTSLLVSIRASVFMLYHNRFTSSA
jgi:hypothetical protein